MQEYISQTFGFETEFKNFKIPKTFPLYLVSGYSYRECCIEDQEILFVTPVDFNLGSYKKHRLKIEELTSLKAVLCIDNITMYQRKILIEEHIPFVVKDSQIYLPFLVVCLTEKYNQKTDIQKFSPMTQLVFLYIFYNNVKLTATEISGKLNCTVMSVSRAYKALTDCGLFDYVKEGRNKYISPVLNGGELLKKAEPYMISPVERISYFGYEKSFKGYLFAGLSALSDKTMLSVSDDKQCYAVFKKDNEKSDFSITEAEYISMGGTKLELWSYDPYLLTENQTVDDISLILSLKDETDERVVSEIQKLRRKYQW